MARKKKFLIKLNDAEEILTKYKITIIQDCEGVEWKGAEINNSSDLMMLALDPEYEVTAYYSTDLYRSPTNVGTLMVSVRKKIKFEPKYEIHVESFFDKLKKIFNF